MRTIGSDGDPIVPIPIGGGALRLRGPDSQESSTFPVKERKGRTAGGERGTFGWEASDWNRYPLGWAANQAREFNNV